MSTAPEPGAAAQPPQDRPAELPEQALSVRWLVVAAGLMSLAVLLAALAYVQGQWREITREVQQRATLHARLLEQQTSAWLSASEVAMRALDDAMDDLFPRTLGDADVARLNAQLADQFRDRPIVRSVSLLTTSGYVLASSQPAQAGRSMAEQLLGELPPPGRTVPGALLSGRDLADAQPLDARSALPTGSPLLPLLRTRELPGGRTVVIVLLLNLDHVASQYELLLQSALDHGSLLRYDGTVLAATQDSGLQPGQRLAQLAPFSRFLPDTEAAQFDDMGLDGRPGPAAFRTLRQWPLVVVTSSPEVLAVQPEFRRSAITAALVALAALLLIGALTLLALRNQRRQAALLLRLNAERERVATSDARNAAVLQSAIDAVLTVDEHGRIVSFNLAAERMFGVSRAQALGQPMADLIVPPRLREAHTQGMARYLSTGQARMLGQRVEITAQRADGSTFPVEVTVVPVTLDGQRLFTGTIRDITEQKRIEGEKAALLAQFRQLAGELEIQKLALDQHAIVTISDARGRITYVNDKLVEISGYEREQLMGRVVDDFRVRPLDARADEAMRAHLRAGRLWQGETTHRRRDGSLYWTATTLVPLRDDAGGISQVIMVQTDISERQLAERALRASETRFRAAFEQAAVGVLQQAVNRRFLRVNQTLCRMLGYSESEFLALDADALIHPDDVMGGLAGMRQLFAGQIPVFRQEKRYRHKDGHYVWTRLTASIARDESGRPEYMIGVVEDIGEIRRAQAEVAAARQRELDTGRRIQQSLLVSPPQLPSDDLWLSAFNQASGGIDGDFFDVLPAGPGLVDVVVGDVMGKGVPAALLGAATKLQFSRSLAELLAQRRHDQGPPSPAAIISAVNRAMAPHLQDLESFVTLVYLRIDLDADTVTWVGCGHEETLLLHVDGRQERLGNQHPPLGIFAELDALQDSRPLGAGDALFLCSDGASDALREDGERVGRERIDSTLNGLLPRLRSPAMALHTLRRELLTTGVRMTDDLTMVLLLRPAVADAAPGQWHRRQELPVQTGSLPLLRALSEAACAEAGLTLEAGSNFTVAAVEALTNIVRHARGRVEQAPVEVLVQADAVRGRVQLELRHLAEPFEPPAEMPDTDFSSFPEGGFGLRIIREACDRVSYSHDAGMNRLVLERSR